MMSGEGFRWSEAPAVDDHRDPEVAAAAHERQVTGLVEEDDETPSYVTQLDERHDAGDRVGADRSLVEEVERYVRRD